LENFGAIFERKQFLLRTILERKQFPKEQFSAKNERQFFKFLELKCRNNLQKLVSFQYYFIGIEIGIGIDFLELGRTPVPKETI
jgi:hypothetical protein